MVEPRIYDKLVRDKIPDIIKANGDVPVTHTASDEEYLQKLRNKLTEETNEYLESGEAVELADALEVIYALAEAQGISREKLEAIRLKKYEERGGFRNRTILDETR